MPAWLTSISLKIGIAAAALVLIGGLWLDNARLRADVTAAQAQTVQAKATCQAEAATAAATQNAATAHAVQQAEAQANAAEAQLQAEFKAGAASATITDATITEDAATPGQDTPVAPVLANLNKALEAGQ